LMSFMRLSSMKAAQVAVSWFRVQKIRASRSFFARCGIPRLLTPSFPVSNPIEETGRVPQVRQGVPGPKKTGEAHDRFGAID